MTHIHIIGDQGQRKYDEDLVSQVNQEIEAKVRREELEKKIGDLQARLESEQENPKPKFKNFTIDELVIAGREYIWLPQTKSQFTIEHPTLGGDGIGIAKQKQHHGKNWYQAHAELHGSGLYMLRIDEFVQFLNLLRRSDVVYDLAGNRITKDESRSIYGEITEHRDPWRGEWLDVNFKVGPLTNKLRLNTNHRTDGKLVPLSSEELESCVMKDCYIDLLSSTNSQGLPTKESNSQVFWFEHPRSNNDSVTRFIALNSGARLNCYWSPESTNAALTVRPSIKLK